jgi:hypothetical protein
VTSTWLVAGSTCAEPSLMSAVVSSSALPSRTIPQRPDPTVPGPRDLRRHHWQGADDLVFTMPGGTTLRLSNWRLVTFIPAAPVLGSAAGSASTTCGTPPPR